MNKIITFLTIALFIIPTYLLAAQSQNLDSVLLEAAANGQTDMVKAFLDKGANIEIKNDAGATPLIFASAKGQKEVVALLLARRRERQRQNKHWDNSPYGRGIRRYLWT